MRPPSGGWSAGECLLHLNLTSERFAPVLEEAVARARAEGLTGTGSFRLDVVGWLLCRLLEPPYRLRTRTPPPFVPDPDGTSARKADVMTAFDTWQARLSAIVRSGEALALDRVRVVSPFAAGVKYSVYSALRIIPVHQRRHLWQAERATGGL